ncbi:MAG: TrmH family RNA methyltransferase [Flavobacteriaceae bacterium]|nr:TrmH family RNA methyltransferase [Flavobacteriaceae bacterium]MCY4267498.1 TrmH family RNA methyltransferase [Flavobacteriaceae bacterium]MCY4297862.1 TrmH family RNA methyltransferase [Flavobacteriaceae bacterium]
MIKKSLKEIERISVEQFKCFPKLNLSLILENIRSLANIGSVFRSADCFRINKIYLTGFSGTPPHRSIQKTALGSTQSVDWEYAKNSIDVIKYLEKKNIHVMALEQTDESISLLEFKPKTNVHYALVVGNEIQGVNQRTLDQVKAAIEIPQFGTKHSFNVSNSASIFMWDFFYKVSTS